MVMAGDFPVKISFVEDMYAEYYPLIASPMVIGGKPIMTEQIEGLYHRKLRTVVGWAGTGATKPAGGCQTARDMFDLYVLSKAHSPIQTMIKQLPYAFATTAFEEGIANMPWFDLIPELDETAAAPQWLAGKDMSILHKHLHDEIGMTEIEDIEQEEQTSPPNEKG